MRISDWSSDVCSSDLLPCGMGGVGGLTQPQIPPGKTFVYEFTVSRAGTFMYHPHADEMVQMAMGMMGLFIVHPRDPAQRRVDRDFAFLANAFDIDPGTYTPRVARSEEHTSELQSLMRISYAVFCLKKNK